MTRLNCCSALALRAATLCCPLLLACTLLAGSKIAFAAMPVPPRLVVLFVIDGLPQRQVTAYRDQLAPDGLRRFLDRGAWFANAHYGDGHTDTAAGHATLLTGAYPHRTGIIGNEWRDPATLQPVYCTGDENHSYIGHQTQRLAGTSPRNLRAESLGDVLKRATDNRAKVIAISGKDRGAILPAGKSGTAYIYMAQSGGFASTTYYMKEHPAWVTQFNAAQLADAYFRKTWAPLLPESAYQRSLPDAQPWYFKGVNGDRLPVTITGGLGKPGPRFYASLLPSPFGDELTLAFARAAVAGEALGQDDAPDILSVSLSGHDYVNHAFGAESRLSHDHVLHVDRYLQAFLKYLDDTIGKDNYVAVITADHGFMPVPEYTQSQGKDAGRLNAGEILARLNAGLGARYGAGNWVLGWSASGILFDNKRIAAQGLGYEAVENAARELLLKEPGIAAAFTKAELASNAPTQLPYLAAMRNSWHAEIAAPLQVVLKPNWLASSYPTGTSHGSPHEYDTHVPILLYGPRWIPVGQIDARVEVADIAPTLAHVLGIAAPAQSEGRLLPLPKSR